GHGHAVGRRPVRLPPPPGADLTQRSRQLADRPGSGRAELTDRAPSCPVPAAAEPAPLEGHRGGVLPAAGCALHRDQPGPFLRAGRAAPARGPAGCPAPARPTAGPGPALNYPWSARTCSACGPFGPA